MPSNLRLQLDIQSTQSYFPTTLSVSPPLAKKQKMSLTQTYRVASTARGKLGREAARSDHNLRLLVGHANLLDSLMVELANAEREQESWFNETVRKADKPEAPKHIQWFDSIVEEDEDELSGSDSDSEVDSDEEMFETPDFPTVANTTQRRRSVSPPPPVFEDDDEWESMDEDFEDDEEHALTRVPSHTPELVHEDSDSDDESMPPSPPQSSVDFDEAQSDALVDLFQKVPPKLARPAVVSEDYMSSRSSQMIAAY